MSMTHFPIKKFKLNFISMKRVLFLIISLSFTIFTNSQSMFDPPVTYFYEETYYLNTDGKKDVGSYKGKYYQFSFQMPNNRIALGFYSDGTPESIDGGYVYTGRVNGYDKYVEYRNVPNYRGGMKSRLYDFSYLLVSPDRKKILDIFVYNDGKYCEYTYEQGDPNNRRKKPKKSSSPYGTPYTNPAPSYTPPQDEKETRFITCHDCNGTGLYPKNESLHSCFNGCTYGVCNKCGRKHCINLTYHENCHDCGGTGKIKQIKTSWGWMNESL